MTQVQKIIKYCALGLAVLLIVSAISVAIGGISLIAGLGGEPSVYEDMRELWSLDGDEKLDSLEIEIFTVGLKIERGESPKVETNSKYISCEFKNGKLTVNESDHSGVGIHNTDTGLVVLTLPEGISLAEASIKTGAGVIDIYGLSANEVDFEFGAGEVKLEAIKSESTELDGGAGKITVISSELNNLDLNMGIGELILEAKISGNSSIDCGVGKVDITLFGVPEDYKLKITRGLGSVDVDGLSADGDFYGNGKNLIAVNGGVGSISVDFSE